MCVLGMDLSENAMVHVWRPEDNLQESVPSFHHVGSDESNSDHQSWWQSSLLLTQVSFFK